MFMTILSLIAAALIMMGLIFVTVAIGAYLVLVIYGWWREERHAKAEAKRNRDWRVPKHRSLKKVD